MKDLTVPHSNPHRAPKGQTSYTMPAVLESEQEKAQEEPRERYIPKGQIRVVVEQLAFYVRKYEEATGALELCIKLTEVVDTLSQVKTTAWIPISRLCATAYNDLSKAYQGDIKAWQEDIPDCPEIEAYVRQYQDRLDLIGDAISGLPSQVSDSDKDKSIGMLSQCSTEMRKRSHKISGELLGHIRTLVDELNELLPGA